MRSVFIYFNVLKHSYTCLQDLKAVVSNADTGFVDKIDTIYVKKKKKNPKEKKKIIISIYNWGACLSIRAGHYKRLLEVCHQ